MRLTLPPLQINPDEPFNKDDDIFGRKEFAERLANLIKNSKDDSLVISLDAQWGEGKTTFVKMFNAYLEKEGATTIYFDAFAHDYIDDAFTAISGEIYAKVSVKIPDKEPDNKFSELVANFLIGSIKLGTKIAITKLGIDKEDIGMLLESASNGISKIVETKIEKYNEHKESLKNFKEELEKLAEALKTKQKQELEQLAIANNPDANLDDIKPYPLIFIVDELDRCKPTYALDVIEKIKHFFSVKNVVFILVMNKKQMETSIKNLYGHDIEASTYLQKFINIECLLPKQIEYIPVNGILTPPYIEQYCEYLHNKHQFNKASPELQETMIKIAKLYNLSLRDLERCYTYLTIFYASIKPNMFVSPLLLVFLVFLKVKETGIYQDLKSRNIAYKDLVENVSYQKASKIPNLDAVLMFLLTPDNQFSNFPNEVRSNKYVQWVESFVGYDRLTFISYLCNLMDSFDFTA